MRNTGLLLVDMLNDLVTGVVAKPAAEPTVDRIGSLIELPAPAPDLDDDLRQRSAPSS